MSSQNVENRETGSGLISDRGAYDESRDQSTNDLADDHDSDHHSHDDTSDYAYSAYETSELDEHGELDYGSANYADELDEDPTYRGIYDPTSTGDLFEDDDAQSSFEGGGIFDGDNEHDKLDYGSANYADELDEDPMHRGIYHPTSTGDLFGDDDAESSFGSGNIFGGDDEDEDENDDSIW